MQDQAVTVLPEVLTSSTSTSASFPDTLFSRAVERATSTPTTGPAAEAAQTTTALSASAGARQIVLISYRFRPTQLGEA